MYNYANILFTGKACNLKCFDCIGNRPELKGLPSNLNEFPLKNIDALLEKITEWQIKDLAFTGTNVDPQLYQREKELIEYVKKKLKTNTNLSLHTNGLLALKKIDIFNSYDKASISLPSFNSETYAKVTRSRKQPDIKKIIKKSKIPIKLSMLVTPFNVAEIDDYIRQCSDIGIKRVVVRKLKGREKEYPLENMPPFRGCKSVKTVFGWPVYKIHNLEVTICSFDTSTAKGLFLFSDGRSENRLV